MANAAAAGLGEANIKNLFVKQINVLGITADNSQLMLPQDAHILMVSLRETAGNAITGGIDIGTTVAGTDVASAVAVAGNAYKAILDAALLKRVFTTAQQLFITAHTSWNGASLNVNIIYAARTEYGT